MKEDIKFQLDIESVYWDQPAGINVYVDDQLMYSELLRNSQTCIKFDACLNFEQHILRIERYNKTDDQCVLSADGTMKDQYMVIKRLLVDGIDTKNILLKHSWYEPEYPAAWQRQQEMQGITLETRVLGENWLAHNGIWYFTFTSPFYKFVIKQFGIE